MKKDRFPCTDEQKWLDQQNWKAMQLYRQIELEMIMSYNTKKYNKPTDHDPMFGDTKKKK